MLINGKEYIPIEAKEKITIADSFVVRANKIGSGNGEAKLYVGNDNQENRDFFGRHGFSIKCFLLKQDLLKYLDETKEEYFKPEQPYRNSSKLRELWLERYNKVSSFSEIIWFDMTEQYQIFGPRMYIKYSDISSRFAYDLIRELSLPNITYISIAKLRDTNSQDTIFYVRLFADYFGEVIHPSVVEEEEKAILEDGNTIVNREKLRARKGQGEYRKKLLEQCPFCPITLISDDRLLIASHIKPWAKSNDFEKTDPYNGFMFTPTIDYLFDRGFITFTINQEMLLSPFLSKMTYSKLGLSDRKKYSKLNVDGRKNYLEYHQKEIWKGRESSR
ncbi:restriction endonuclease [Rodentibacter caecimuris]|uniref:Restriction endonuclease n=1 Tax=Rodentibacter caecimuris TaxID=1796644 RepID=A0A1V3KL75_9PAST|nr:HNH endonuclease signature motif containing protein [Rodentibacter heylii]OOF78411.1 restriction endonuclease [Rodentibacter heylii]